ncbi:ATP-dependent DNA helicase UvrD [Flavobacterium columnare]|uniref:UvrD-helicase domain-containing protein n=1 Tax=Flavobacterium columnare TaxID=996 RepID=UPI0007F9EEC8|nr:UvrD-helicase domain-containing protein [Flavobacterium columnare]ANO49350.1 ATP-dependent DNA helicase UvrD [Flavobacterium columnare]APT22678.1 hypothetical protein BU993_08600 [Flavobacterium columnare]
MVTKRLELKDKQPEVFQILQHIDNRNHFLLSGGAGSGKTYSLVSIIRQILEEQPTAQIACITYTNAAVKEIEERVNHKKLKVSTIHDFLWDCIKNFQRELKKCVIDLAKNDSITSFQLDNPDISIFEGKKIEYKEFVRLTEGIISHDELLILAEAMFANYPKLCDNINDKFNFIFVDEYQDTDKLVVEILLNHLSRSKKMNKTIIGFFGDAMQSIYEDRIGNLDEYLKKEDTKLKKVIKAENRRNPQKVIDLANKLRTDTVTQQASKDLKAPNMLANGNVKEGNVLFLHSTKSDLPKLKKYLSTLDIDVKWNFDDSKNTKELNLTHNLIASQANFSTLMNIYDKEPILSLKADIVKGIKENNLVFEENMTFDEVVNKSDLKAQPYLMEEILSNKIALEEFNKIKKLKKEDFQLLEFENDLLGKLKEKVSNVTKKKLNDLETIEDIVNSINFKIKVSKKDKLLSNEENKLLYEKLRDKPFIEVKKIYIDKDHLIDDKKEVEDEESKKGSKRDNLIKHLFKIQHTLSYYENKNFPEFFRIMKKNNVGYKINSIKEKEQLKENIEKLLKNNKITIGEVIDKADELGIVIKNDKPLNDFRESKGYIYDRVAQVPYQEFINLYNYLEGFTPYSTQHKTKGSEYDNVLVVLDNADWTKYSFKHLFENTKDKEKIIERTQKLFYVCCTRAKENLVVLALSDMNDKAIENVKKWFGEENVLPIEDFLKC